VVFSQTRLTAYCLPSRQHSTRNWLRPKNELFDPGFLFTPSDTFSLGRTISPQYIRQKTAVSVKVINAIEMEGNPGCAGGGRKQFEKPAFVVKVRNSLLKCAHLKRGTAVHEGDSVSLKETDDFISLYNNEFTDRLASINIIQYSTVFLQ